MPELVVRIKKHTDGTATLSCTRRDGTTTWQRQRGALGQFFPLHDLTHFAVESVLGYRRGFYGLVADGWEMTDFGTPWPRGPLPAETVEAEMMVGFFDSERRLLQRFSAEEVNEQAANFMANRVEKGARPSRTFTDAQLADVRALRADVFARWAAIEPGDALELAFDRELATA
ncbi:MAG: hypothetical protein M3081_20570 [Gemmatimonadota bacterium]|nr:hypothetical protein [Gemmatimonadota bacterium]